MLRGTNSAAPTDQGVYAHLRKLARHRVRWNQVYVWKPFVKRAHAMAGLTCFHASVRTTSRGNFCSYRHHPEKRISFNLWPIKDVFIGKVAFQTYNDLVIFDDDCKFGISRIENDPGTRWLDRRHLWSHILLLRNVFMMPPCLILFTLMIKCRFFGYMSTPPTGNSSHLGLTMPPISDSGTHELANSFSSFQCPRCIGLPSHLLGLNIPWRQTHCS